MQKTTFSGRSAHGSNRLITKMLLVMKLTFVLLTAAFLHVNAKSVSQMVHFSGKNVPLKMVFSELKKQTDYVFTYTDNMLIGTKPISIEVENISLEEFLQKILADQPLKYIIEYKTVLLSRKVVPSVGLKSTDAGLPPPGSVQGRVMDENNEPVPGATVMIKGTTNGTATDENGNYNITVPNQESVLIFSALGFKTKEIKVGNQSMINVVFIKKVEAFDEIIVSANLVASKSREVSSAVTTITSDDIERLPVNSVSELFRTEVPGAISWSSGPGTDYNGIQLRGSVDFASSSQVSSVKIFIDGLEIANPSILGTLSLAAIDHIEILHGPQASTLYGSGSTSGVIYIFTKKGKEGLHINAKISAGIIASRYVDKTPYQFDHSLNVSGGNEGISYNAGATYQKVDPIWEGADSKNTSMFAGVKAKHSNVTIELTGVYAKKNHVLPLNPILKGAFPTVPLFSAIQHKSNEILTRTVGMNIEYAPFKWWQHNASMGIDQNTTSNIQKEPSYLYPSDTLNLHLNTDRKMKSYRYFTTFKIPTGNFFTSTLTAGISYSDYEIESNIISGTGVDPNFVPVSSTYSRAIQKFSNTGWFAQGVLGFDDKLFVTAGMRSEKTKSYEYETKASVAPKIGASFVTKWGNTSIKPRASYGKSIKVPDPSQTVGIIQDYPEYGITIIQLANPDLKPQDQVGFDVGIDVQFAKGLGSLEATYYNQSVHNFITFLRDDSNFPPIS